MPALKEYTHRIKSLRNTRKITKTMKMVAARSSAGPAGPGGRAPVFHAAHRTDGSSSSRRATTSATPFCTPRATSKRALVLLFSSDRGLCGGFNNQIAKQLDSCGSARTRAEFERVDVSFCGRRGYNALKNRVKVRRHYEGVTNKPAYADACRISAELKEPFLAERYDEIYLPTTSFTAP